jgi:Fic family protein
MQHNLYGIRWSAGQFDDCHLMDAEPSEFAAFLLRHYKKEFTWNVLRGFEGIRISSSQVSDIMKGLSVPGLLISDMLKVKHYGDAIDAVCFTVKNKTFDISKRTACMIHSIAGKDEVEEAGMFRTRFAELHNTTYTPPDSNSLENIWNDGISSISSIDNALERACILFLFMSRTHFFLDCNKRTALLMANGELIKHCIHPFFIPHSDIANFDEILGDFYETGQADAALQLLCEYSGTNENQRKILVHLDGEYF